MINNTGVPITSFSLPVGATSTENVYLCLESIAIDLKEDTYNTVGNGQWLITST